MIQRIFLCILFLATHLSSSGGDSIQVLIITGGHKFHRPAFFEMFKSFKNISYTEVVQPQGNILIQQNATGDFDVLVFYDMYDSITEAQKEAYIKLLKKGKAVIFLHHALVSYQHWPEFFNIIGGKFVHKDSTQGGSVYRHDVTIPIEVADGNHEITKGLADFSVFDETYGNCLIKEDVRPLLTTKRAGNMPYVAWVNAYGNSQVVYMQLGHGPQVFLDKNYRAILYRAILWSVEVHKRK